MNEESATTIDELPSDVVDDQPSDAVAEDSMAIPDPEEPSESEAETPQQPEVPFSDLKVNNQHKTFKHVTAQHHPSGQTLQTGTARGPYANLSVRFELKHEAYLELAVSFPTKPEDDLLLNGMHVKRLRFYGQTFKHPMNDIKVSHVHEVNRGAVNGATSRILQRNCLWLLTLIYDPKKVVAFHLDEIADYVKPAEAEHCVDLLRQMLCIQNDSAVRSILYIYIDDSKVSHMLGRFTHLAKCFDEDKKSPRLSEYKTENGEYALQWNARGYTPAIDRGPVKEITHFRHSDQALVTQAFGEMREIGAAFELLPEARTSKLTLKFEAFGPPNRNGLPSEYWANGDTYPNHDLAKLVEVGSMGTLSFAEKDYSPSERVASVGGWRYHVRAPLSAYGFEKNLLLHVWRPDSDLRVVAIPATDMDVYLSPEIPDTNGRIFVNTAKRMIDGQGSNFDEIRGYISCQNFETSATPRYLEYYRTLSEQDMSNMDVFSEAFNKEQLHAAAEILQSTRPIQVVHGSPGTGKTWWTARMIGIYRSLGLPVLATAPSNIAADAILNNLIHNDREFGWNVLPVRFAGDKPEIDMMVELWEAFHHRPSQKQVYRDSLSASEVRRIDAVEDLSEAGKSPRHRPTLDPASLHYQILIKTGIFVDGQWRRDKPEPIENDPYADFIDMWYDTGFPVNRQATQQHDGDQDQDDAGDDNTEGENPDDYLNTRDENFENAEDVYHPPEKPDTKTKPKYPPTVRSITRDTLKVAISNVSCVVCTCASSDSQLIRQNFRPHVVFVDEAAYAHFLEALTAMITTIEEQSLLITVFVGDTKQLRPVVTSKHVVKADGNPLNPFWAQVQTSWPEQLEHADCSATMLREQNRMAPGLADFSNRKFYGNRLRNAEQVSFRNRPIARKAVDFMRDVFGLETEFPKAFINLPDGKTITTSSISRANYVNLTAGLHIIALLLRHNVCKSKDITVVTPYKGQCSAYNHALKNLRAKSDKFLRRFDFTGITVKTIESFQGGEQSIVIFDLVVSRVRQGNPGFITDPRRLNVALTRGRDSTIVLGDHDCFLEQDQRARAKLEQKHAETGEPPNDQSDISGKVKSTLRELFLHYKEQNAFKDISEATLLDYQVAKYIDFEQAEAGELEVSRARACKKCGQDRRPDHNCPVTEKIAHQHTQCYKCKKYGHFGSDCLVEYCGKCKKPGHVFGYCPDMHCSKCFEDGHKAFYCMNADKRTCDVCGKVGHVAGPSCPHTKSRFSPPWSNLPVRPKRTFTKKGQSEGANESSSAAEDVDPALTKEATEIEVAEGNWESADANEVVFQEC